MHVEFDEAKRAWLLRERSLDVARATLVFEGFHLTRRDDDHSTQWEKRFNSVGVLDGQVVIVTWTMRGTARRIVTMWKANTRERERYHEQHDRRR